MKVASWNLARGLSSTDKSNQIITGLDKLDADLVFLPEAYDRTGEPFDPDFASRLGYTSVAAEYEDREPHPSDEQYIVALSRTTAQLESIRLGTRNAVDAHTTIQGEEVMVVGAHFDDRREYLRIGMAQSFIASLNQDIPSALIGDLNAMHAADIKALILSSDVARSLAAGVRHDRARSIATRLTDMASGDTIELLKAAGFSDADPKHRSTMLLGGIAVAQLDHLMHNSLLRVESFQAKRLKGSDHKAVSAELLLI